MQKTWMALAVTAALSACGGGGGAGGVTSSTSTSSTASSSSTATSVTLSGKVMDGYLQGAEVCLDINADKVCDSAKVITDANGGYSLTQTLTAEQLASAHVLAVVPDTAKDADDGGKTLKEAGKAAFELLAPAAKPQVVSPLSTLVSERMISNRQSMNDAESSVAATLKLETGTALLGPGADYTTASQPGLKQQAQTAAVLLGEVKKVVSATVSSHPGVVTPDVQQRIEADAVRDMLSNIVAGQQLAQLLTDQKTDPKKVQQLAATLVTQAAYLTNGSLLAQKGAALTPPPATFNISQLVGQPLYNVEKGSNQVNVCTDSMTNSLLTNICYVTYNVNGAWQPWKREESSLELTAQGVVRTDIETPFKLLQDTATTFQAQDFVPKLHAATYTVRSQGPVSPSVAFKDVSFAASDIAYPMSKKANPGVQVYEYHFRTDYPRYCGGVSSDCASLQQFRTYYSASQSNFIGLTSGDTVRAQFSDAKVVFYERKLVNNVPTYEKLPAEGSWTARTVAGVELMDVIVPDELKAKLSLEAYKQLFYITYQGKVYDGRRSNNTDYAWFWLNASAFEKVRQFYNLPALPR